MVGIHIIILVLALACFVGASFMDKPSNPALPFHPGWMGLALFVINILVR
jgi:hypothetical protein